MDTYKEETEPMHYGLPKKLDVGSRRVVWRAILETEDPQGITFWRIRRLVNKSSSIAMLSFLKHILAIERSGLVTISNKHQLHELINTKGEERAILWRKYRRTLRCSPNWDVIRRECKPSMLHTDFKKRLVDYYNLYDVDYRTERGINIHYGFYDSGHREHHAAIVNMIRVLADKAKITSKDIILDAGCGFGGSSIWLAKNIGAKVIGININEEQVKKAGRLVKKNKVDHLVKFYVDDFANTKFPDESFDVVWGLESICYAENKKDFIAEAKRILKKNGRLIVADGFKRKDKFTESEQKIMEKWMEGWVVPNLASVSEFKGYLQELEFKKIDFWDITKNVMPTSEEMYKRAISWFPIIKKLESVGLWTKAQKANVASAIYQHRLFKDKLCSYGIFYAEKGEK